MVGSEPSFLSNLAPLSLAESLPGSSLAEFEERHGRSEWLLVALDDGTDELRSGLLSTLQLPTTTLQPSLSVLGYDTVLRESLPPPEALAAALREPAAAIAFGPEAARSLIERMPLFAIQLRKRAGDAYAERISVGRARNKDVVLREESVSKFHAWFEMDEEGNFFVADAGSKNGTRAAGRLLPPRELVPVQAGDTLHFGSVRATLCPHALLWRACQGA